MRGEWRAARRSPYCTRASECAVAPPGVHNPERWREPGPQPTLAVFSAADWPPFRDRACNPSRPPPNARQLSIAAGRT
ncbi:hypothetical protein RhiLY_07178 [Ceratobasidium sp. AG-Ba]|nr:hypothetical protein RhiLY_07178 [Ceratobasidium sp. AG-Ba]